MADGLEFIKEIQIEQYWRKHLGEFEYLRYNPDDLRRWYDALELRGPLDIRDYLIERNGRHTLGAMTGIVAAAPHPPRDVVQIWLESHTEKVHTRQYWLAAAAFLLFSIFVGENMQGCSNLKQMSRFDLNPPKDMPLPQRTGPSPTTQATSPTPLPPPAQTAAKPGGRPH